MADLSTFEQYYKLADMLIEKGLTNSLLNVPDYSRSILLIIKKDTRMPLDETLALADMSAPIEAQGRK
jgi:hypothetical protein